MNFGEAIEALKSGESLARKGWNGKGMCIWLNKGSYPADEVYQAEGIPLGLFDAGDKGTVARLPNINMTNACGNTVTGWLASQADMLAEDWVVVLVAPAED